ncbi:MAG: glycosyltransferase family 4 protein [Phormidesmis sp.]
MHKHISIFISDWRSNPYKALLSKHLYKYGILVEELRWSTLFIHKVLARKGVRVLHFHTLHPFLLGKSEVTRLAKLIFFIAQITFLKLFKIKAVWTVHELKDKLGDNTNNISPLQAKALGFFIDGFIVHCESTRDSVVQFFALHDKEQKVHVIPHGNYIDIYRNEISSEEARAKLYLPKRDFVFLLIGGIYRYKGVLEAINAFKAIQENDSYLVIAGKLCEANLEEDIALAIGDSKNILFVPEAIEDDDMQVYINAANCVLLPYGVFTTSGVALLAMSFGKACIAPSVGFFKDTLQGAGALLYDTGDQAGLSKSMSFATNHPTQVDQIGHQNFDLAQRWSWAYVAEKTYKAYGYKPVSP